MLKLPASLFVQKFGIELTFHKKCKVQTSKINSLETFWPEILNIVKQDWLQSISMAVHGNFFLF